jgi:hypothetical protein
MYIKDLIKELQKFNQESQIFVSNDSEGNEIKTIDMITEREFDKKNNDGTYDAVVIYPTDTLME